MADIPITQARLASSVELRLMLPVQIDFGFGVTFEFQPGLTLGTISRLTRTQVREIHRRYSLGSFAHEPFDLIPGRITTDLKLEKIVLYSEYMLSNLKGDVAKVLGLENKTIYLSDGDLLGALGFVSGNLFYQQQPFAIEEVVHAPDVTGGQPTITSYLDCWLKTNPIEYDMMSPDKQLTIQECDVACGQVKTSIPFDKAIAPIARRLITDVINLGSK
jgi:hypothetical protein